MNCLYSVNDIEQQYQGRSVLRVAQMCIETGEVLAFVGPSGAGKSTLLRLLALLETPTRGALTLSLDGVTYPSHSVPIDVQRQIAMVFQRPALLSRTVRANVAAGLRFRGERDTHARVDEALARVALTHLADAYPRTLSGGEMQRVAIARALVLQPRILLLDEPTANLDPYNVGIIESLIADQRQRFNTTVVLVTHNIFQAKRLADRVALFYEGELVEVSPKARFFEASENPRTRAFTSGQLVY
mgnify:FL=1